MLKKAVITYRSANLRESESWTKSNGAVKGMGIASLYCSTCSPSLCPVERVQAGVSSSGSGKVGVDELAILVPSRRVMLQVLLVISCILIRGKRIS